jgi:hypothetical protein
MSQVEKNGSGAMTNVKELEALVAHYRGLLEEAEQALAAAKNREPQVGDFVRSTLTSFYGRVTRVIPRSQGRPWLEITPYLAPDLPGTSTLDLFGDWEFIDEPTADRPAAASASASFALIAEQLAAALTGPERHGEREDERQGAPQA